MCMDHICLTSSFLVIREAVDEKSGVPQTVSVSSNFQENGLLYKNRIFSGYFIIFYAIKPKFLPSYKLWWWGESVKVPKIYTNHSESKNNGLRD